MLHERMKIAEELRRIWEKDWHN